jgi:hypothetical protein
MSVPTILASNQVPFALSLDGGLTYKNVVCKKLWGMTIDKTLVQEETDCDTLTAVGATKFSFNFEFVLNTTPNTATEISANEVAEAANEGTIAYAKLQADGYYRQGGGYITNYQENAAQGGMVSATGTFTGSGPLALSE